jgi:hypothetical protein
VSDLSLDDHPRRRRIRWSLKTQFAFGAILLAVVLILVLVLVEKTVWDRMELITGILAGLMFLYFFTVLYHGVRFDKKEKIHFRWASKDPTDFVIADFGDCFFGIFTEMGLEEGGPIGLVFGLILDLLLAVIVSALLGVILWLSLNLVVATVLVLFIPLFLIFSRSLRYIVARGRHCIGDLGAACLHAVYYTVAWGGWFYAVVYLSHAIGSAMGWAKT